MKKVLLVLAALSFSLGASYAQPIIVGDYGETGWQTYSETFTEPWSGQAGFAVSNFGDTDLDSVLLLDNSNVGPLGNSGFELNNFNGYTSQGDVSIVSSFNSSAGNTYNPTEGSYMVRLLASGADTSAYGGTDGSYLWITDDLSFNAGDTVSFDWAFLAFDEMPFEDFSILLAEADTGGFDAEVLAKIGTTDNNVIPEPASLLLLGSGLLGLAGLRKRKGRGV